jgi:hypothetical protein
MASTHSKKRHAALVRWRKNRAGGMQQANDIQAEVVNCELRAVLVVQEASRAFRRGESNRVKGQVRGYSIDEVVEAVSELHEARRQMARVLPGIPRGADTSASYDSQEV